MGSGDAGSVLLGRSEVSSFVSEDALVACSALAPS